MTFAAFFVICSALGAARDTAIVCPHEFSAALRPWVEFRESQGHQVTFLSNSADANEVRGAIRGLAAAGGLRYLLLVGDAAAVSLEAHVDANGSPKLDGLPAPRSSLQRLTAGGPNSPPAGIAGHVPTRHVRAKVNVRWGSEPHIATDNWYADLDDDGAPELAVGRLTADSAEEVSLMVKKILAYERSRDFGPWRRHLHFVAGLGGFGPLVDSVLETSAKNVIAAGLPASYGATLTQASWSSPFYPDPRRFRETAQEGLNDGCLFWIYMGHGQRRELDQIPQAAPRFRPILDASDARALRARNGAPIVCLFSCYAGAFDGPEDCLAEELLRAPGGPVAVLAGSRVTMPYAMTLLGAEMLEQCFTQQQATLGDALLAAKRAVVAPAKSHSLRASLDAMAALLSPAPGDMAAERQEHLAMFNLLGDPLLGIRQPKAVVMRAESRSRGGAGSNAPSGPVIHISARSPIAGAALVEIVAPRDELRFQPGTRSEAPETGDAASECGDTYARANDPVWMRQTIAVPAGDFEITLPIPAAAHGHCLARIFITGESDFALGATEVAP